MVVSLCLVVFGCLELARAALRRGDGTQLFELRTLGSLLINYVIEEEEELIRRFLIVTEKWTLAEYFDLLS